jgi:uncharacterized repeat protein (TIGR02543 family)
MKKKINIKFLFVILTAFFMACTNWFEGGNPTDAAVPLIIHQPANVEIFAGENFTLTVDAVSTDGGILLYQWYLLKTGNTETSSTDSTTNSYEKSFSYSILHDETNNTLSVSGAQKGIYFYVCKIINVNEDRKITRKTKAEIETSIAVVTVINNTEIPTEPETPDESEQSEKNTSITVNVTYSSQEDINLTVEKEENLTIFTASDGYDAYAWKVDGKTQSGQTDSRFELNTTSLDGVYTVTVFAKKGVFEYSSSATLEVIKTYTVTYISSKVPFKSEVNPIATYTYKTGLILFPEEVFEETVVYTFAGWYYDQDYLTNEVTEISKGETGNKVLYAKWNVNKKDKDGNLIINETLIPNSSEILAIPLGTQAVIDKDTPDSSVFTNGRKVKLSPFYISQYEVNEQLHVILGRYIEEVSLLPGGWYNWFHAISYCNKLSMLMGYDCVYSYDLTEYGFGIITDPDEWKNNPELSSTIPMSTYFDNYSNWKDKVKIDISKNGYRLPTIAEWEFVARGGDPDAEDWNYTFSGSNTIDEAAWYAENSNNETHESGTKTPNRLGVYDMSGNVLEWCNDFYNDDAQIDDAKFMDEDGYVVNPMTETISAYRCIRGGSYLSEEDECKVADNGYEVPCGRMWWESLYNVGFRLVRSAW